MAVQDNSRHDLIALMWQWLDESYAEFDEALGAERAALGGECKAYAQAIAHLAGMPIADVRKNMKRRHAEALIAAHVVPENEDEA